MIDLTPLDVRKKKGDFPRALRGYETPPVDEFLELAAERMEELVRENATLRERTAHLVETLTGYRQREQAMTEALVSAQQLRDEVRAQAARDAEMVLQQAQLDAERILAEAVRQATEAAEAAQRSRAAHARFLRGFRTFLERHLDEVESEAARISPPVDGVAGGDLAP